MAGKISRRDFLKLGGLTLGSLAFRPFSLRGPEGGYGQLARVTIQDIDLRAEPRDDAPIIGKRYRDQLVHIYYDLNPPDAPAFYNTLWYRVWGGYLHSSYLQIVDVKFNQPLDTIREEGQLSEVTVPYTQSYSFSQFEGWRKEYRLYYETTHWITGLDEGPDGGPWYRITDELQPFDYFVPAEHLRAIPDEEVEPISPDVPAEAKRIEIDLARQRLFAYEGDEQVFQARISSGVPSTTARENGTPTDTPKGRFNVTSKMPSKHMGDGNLMLGDFDINAYELVGVPWTTFFVFETGVALHGTYWHNNFGYPMSHGCVNMRNADAKWMFRWTTPVNADPPVIERTGYGTRINVF